ncbi:MAG: Hsp70 family protein [Anaerolineaceae bacterium]|nr:Hsp70 family protein [Anaerolineaceae bacterium]
MFVGIDFGTSNSSIALYEGEKLSLFELDPHNQNPYVLPSFTYINRDHDVMVGAKAIETYLEEETGRRPVWETRNLGEVEITVAGAGSSPIIYMQDINVEIDVAANGRLLQSIKTGLRDAKYEGTQIFDRFYTVEELIAILLTQLREKCEQTIHRKVEDVVLGRPVKFSDDPVIDARAQQKIYDAARLAGFKNIVFELEPIGGAYLYHQNQKQRENVIVFDFGGGTLDMTVIEVGGTTTPKTIATQGVLLGGDDLTAVLMQRLFQHFGEGSHMPDGLPFPAHVFAMLYSWQNMIELSRPKYADIFSQARTGSDPLGIQRLETLVNEKLGFKLFRELESAKIKLSTDYMTTLSFFENELSFKELVLRTHFEKLIREELEMVDKALDELMLKSGLKPDQIQAVLRTGGSSEVPIFIERLSERFGIDRIKEINPFTTIVGGLALKGYELSKN